MSKKAFGQALRDMRHRRQLTQEDFNQVSSRTYLSTLERGMYSPTLDKVEELASVLEIHPLSLIALYHLNQAGAPSLEQLFEQIRQDLTLPKVKGTAGLRRVARSRAPSSEN